MGNPTKSWFEITSLATNTVTVTDPKYPIVENIIAQARNKVDLESQKIKVVRMLLVYKAKIKPDINVILGDRPEVLASAISAYTMNIPNAHIHGGDVSGNIDEYTRHAITKISNIHFPATQKSKDRIVKMGENPKSVLFVGSPSIDDIQSGRFARDWMQECKVDQPSFKSIRRKASEHKIEEVGKKLRAMMPWIADQKLVDKDKN